MSTTMELAGTRVDVDGQGFLTDHEQWSDEVGIALAAQASIALTDKHWEVLRFARQDFVDNQVSPGPRRIVANTAVTMRELYKLFPRGPGKLVARIAGIPKPKSCL